MSLLIDLLRGSNCTLMNKMKKNLQSNILLLPALIAGFFCYLFPILIAFGKSFFLGTGTDFVGIQNYVDLFENAASIERIICPSSQAWERYAEILDACRQLPKDRLMLVSLGAAGKVLTVDLHRLGYRVIDVGSLDMEYGWFCEGAAEKCRVIKHEIHTREENEAAGYFDYLDQILTTIH